MPPPPRPTLFPYTTLFRSIGNVRGHVILRGGIEVVLAARDRRRHALVFRAQGPPGLVVIGRRDRKSTRLNSSHLGISYAVFCLKKKKQLTHNDSVATIVVA